MSLCCKGGKAAVLRPTGRYATAHPVSPADLFLATLVCNVPPAARLLQMRDPLPGAGAPGEPRVAWASVTREALNKVGALPSDTEDLVDYTVSILGVELGFLLMELPAGGIKLSLRSRGPIDCCELAGKFGGGGHRAAAGATLPEPIDKALEAVKRQVALLLK